MPQTFNGIFDAEVRSEIEIDAPAERIFDILTDVKRYAEWNPFTPDVESTLRVGDPVDMQVQLRVGKPLSHQVEIVTANDRPERLCWGADLGHRLLIRADRCQGLVALGPERTRYVCTDRIRGALTPVVMRFFGHHMQRGFDDCARALKARAEA